MRYPRTVPKNAEGVTKLNARTLTKLYNKSPAWLTDAHAKLNELVLATYGWSPDLPDDELLARLLERNLSCPTDATPVEADAEVETVTATG